MSQPAIEIAFRIPGPWGHPKELLDRLPAGCRLTPESLSLADGTEVGFGAAPADNQFAAIFLSSCRNEPTPAEQKTVENYRVNAFLMGPGGSLESAHKMMEAAGALLHAGGAGVFIDNSTVAHGAEQWLAMTEDGSPDALSFAYVAIVRGEDTVWTMGMHTLGLRDIHMKLADMEEKDQDGEGGFDIVDIIRYLARGDKPVADNHIIADLGGPRFRVYFDDGPQQVPQGSPMHNPFGRLKLVSIRDIAAGN